MVADGYRREACVVLVTDLNVNDAGVAPVLRDPDHHDVYKHRCGCYQQQYP